MITLILLWVALIIAEIGRHQYMIEDDHNRPTYWKVTIERIFVGFIFWVCSPFTWKEMTYWQWWGMLPMMGTSFWFIFDYGLNLARKKKPFYYLNPKGSFLDKFQCEYPAPYFWFWVKLIFMYGGWIMFNYGLDAIWNGV